MVRVRFAPSPTGNLHIGGLRALLFNYYFAKKNKGSFLIRIEDTDLERNKTEYTEAILNALEWCDIKSDEKILYQSDRKHIYDSYIKKLIDSGEAYYCDEVSEKNELTKVIKCKVNKSNSHITFHDIIRGDIAFPVSEIDDFIIVRSDGTPLYNLVVVIDDIEMGISHIIRGEEHLSNTPKQLILYKAFHKIAPHFAHLPLILGSDRKKLSKRDAATSVMDYQSEGFLPEALCMYLMRLGWAYGNQEIFSYEEILKYFRLEDVHHAGAIFDRKKLLSINNLYIKKYNSIDLYNLLVKWKSNFFEQKNKNRDIKIISLYQSRSCLLNDFIDAINIIDEEKSNQLFYNNKIEESQMPKEEMIKIVKLMIYLIDKMECEFDLLFKNDLFKSFEKMLVYKSVRYALLGITESPSIIDIMKIFGKNEVLRRMNKFIAISK